MRSIEEKATQKDRLYSAESSDWEERLLGRRLPIHWNSVSASTRKRAKKRESDRVAKTTRGNSTSDSEKRKSTR